MQGYNAINNKKGQATTWFKIGWLHTKTGKLDDAMQADLNALALMEELDDKLGIAGAYSRLSEDVSRRAGRRKLWNGQLKPLTSAEK